MFWRRVSIEGPIELVDGKLLLVIPLDKGGDRLARYAKSIGEVEGDNLVLEIRPWLAEQLNVHAGSLVIVDNYERKFRITRSPAND